MERTKYQNKIREGYAWQDQNTCDSSPWTLSSVSAGISPSPNQVWAQSNSICPLAHNSGSSPPPLSSTSLPNNQKSSLIQKKLPGDLPRYIQKNMVRKCAGEDTIAIPGGLKASPSGPTNTFPSGSSSYFTSAPVICFTSVTFCACSTS